MRYSKTDVPTLFVILSRFPYPLEKGDKLRAYYQLRELSSNFQIHLFCLSDHDVEPDQITQIEQFCKSIYIHRIRRFGIFWRLFLNLFTRLPFQVAYFNSFSAKLKIKKILNDLQPDHILSQLIRTSELVKNYHACPKTLDYMDALSIGMDRRANKAKGLWRIVFLEEAGRLRDYERLIFNYFEKHVIISEQDRNYIAHPDRLRIKIIPNGIDITFFDVIEVNKTHDLVFVGNLSYPPNIAAATFIIKELLPLTSGKTLLLGGAHPVNELQRQATKNKNVSLTGWMEDIRQAYLKGRIFIAPMHTGTGMQNKLLEAMALGVPCITSSLANNAIRGIHEVHLMVADDPQQMIGCIQKLETDHTFYSFIADNAREFVRKNYSWKASVFALQKMMDTPMDTAEE